jgi:hypothetical protein
MSYAILFWGYPALISKELPLKNNMIPSRATRIKDENAGGIFI